MQKASEKNLTENNGNGYSDKNKLNQRDDGKEHLNKIVIKINHSSCL